MREIFTSIAITLTIFLNNTSATYCDNIRRKSLVERNYTESGKPTNLLLLWGSEPAYAASALLAVIIRYKFGYQNVFLVHGPHTLQDLAAKVERYDGLILALSTAWKPENAPEWIPNSGAASGLAGPYLQEFGASPIPVRLRVHVFLPDQYRRLTQCANASQLFFYEDKDLSTLSQCGFTAISRVGQRDKKNILVYDLTSSNTTTIEQLQFQMLDRKRFFQMLRFGNQSFLFYDYDIWEDHPKINIVQLPPCLSGETSTCHQELDEALPIRVTEIYRLDEFAPQLLQFVHDFTPPYESIWEILELESLGKNIDEAACEWVSKHNAIVDSWLSNYGPSETRYEIAIFYCSDNPDYKEYLKYLEFLETETINIMYKSMFKIVFRRYTNCSSTNYVKHTLDNYLMDLARQHLIGVIVGGVKDISEVVKAVDGQTLPVMLYDAPGVDVDLTTSVWLSTGRSLHLAYALKYFALKYEWTRIAILSDPTPSAKRFVEDFKTVGGIHIRNYLINLDLTLFEAKTVLQLLKDDNARIIFVNTNYKDAATILSAGVILKMNSTKDYAWIVSDWRPNSISLHIKHFTISFSYRCKNVSRNEVNLYQQLTSKMNEIWPDCTWPPHAAALADAVLTLVEVFKSAIQKFSWARDDTHSEEIFQYFKKGINELPVAGFTQSLTYKGQSLEEARVFIEEWNNQRSFLARWRVNVTKGKVVVEHEQRSAYPFGNPPHDGALECLARSGDPYLPTCNDTLWAIGLIVTLVTTITIQLITLYVRHRLKEHEKKIVWKLLMWRQHRVAALSNSYLVKRSTLELREELGAGKFGRVNLALQRIPGRKPRYVAAKALRDLQDESGILREACTLASLDHNHIIRLIGVCIDKEPPILLMEFAFFGDLLRYLQTRRYLAKRASFNLELLDSDEEEAKYVSAEALTQLARQVASALAYLALNGIIHRDVRASNCLIDANRSLKLADFGMARETLPIGAGNTEYACQRRGLFPVLWMAPESLVQGVFSTASDVWGLGVLLFELVTLGARPYGDMSLPQVMRFVSKDGGRPPMPRDATPQTVGLALLCWKREAEQRPTAAELVAYLADRPCALHPAFDYDQR